MSEERLISVRQPVKPQWEEIRPGTHEHAPPGRPPFDILYIPETPRLINTQDLFLNLEGRKRNTGNPELESLIQSATQGRKRKIDEFNAALSEGATEKRFFDGELARLHPHDIAISGTSLLLRLGITTYFTYTGTRSRGALQRFGYDKLGLPLGVCAILFVPSEDGTKKLVYTVRNPVNENYPGWYHAVGGTVQTVEHGIANPNSSIKKEIGEELGLSEKEVQMNGIAGLVMNNFDVHPELIYLADVSTPIEQWFNKRETDEEVNAKFFTDTPENLARFILGQLFDEVPRPRPLVPGGLAAYLLYGRLKYGQNWYNDVYCKIPQY